ncbi:MAG: cyclase family protein [Oscillospiraceae bacterium]
MLTDITLRLTKEQCEKISTSVEVAEFCHTGTHLDIMEQTFPVEYLKRDGIAFDVRGVENREIGCSDLDISLVEKDMFVALFTDFGSKHPFGSTEYAKNYPAVSHELIFALTDKDVAIIGVDCAGLRHGDEHQNTDAYCAGRASFVLENLCNLGSLFSNGEKTARFVAYTFPLSLSGMSGLPCRVAAEKI